MRMSIFVLFLLSACASPPISEDCGCGVIIDSIGVDLVRRDNCSGRIDTLDFIAPTGWGIGDTICDLVNLDE